jgi:hypothetical protein
MKINAMKDLQACPASAESLSASRAKDQTVP